MTVVLSLVIGNFNFAAAILVESFCVTLLMNSMMVFPAKKRNITENKRKNPQCPWFISRFLGISEFQRQSF
jgi:hypothetical protein